MAQKMRTINCAPTWTGLLPLFREYIFNGTEAQKQYLYEELTRLCALVDRQNAKKG
jgi:hypothetical protein